MEYYNCLYLFLMRKLKNINVNLFVLIKLLVRCSVFIFLTKRQLCKKFEKL